ncbi:MAG TPA: hypothetical protein VNO55_22050, partial [Polyangia bacterium]|nr:hypothetical protein [Polyangia bacterium]
PRRSAAVSDVTPPPQGPMPGRMPEPYPKRSSSPPDPAMMMTPAPVAQPAMPQATTPFERRQPPAPEEVVMSAFQQGAVAASTADQSVATNVGASPRVQFRAPLDAPSRSSRGPKIAALIMLILLAAAGIAYYLWTNSVAAAAVRHVRVLSPKPTAVYRWFDSTGRVTGGESRTLAFEGGGRVTDILPAGSTYAAGEIIARLQGAALVETDVSRHRARLLFYEQMRDSMRAVNNAPELRQAEIKIGIKSGLLADAEALLAPRVIRPVEAGQIIEVLVKPGDTVQPHMAALKINPGRLRGEFMLTEADWPAAGTLAFCRVEVVGQAPTASIDTARKGEASSAADSGPPQAAGSARYLDCQARPEGAGAGQVVVELPLGAPVTVGQPLRLARARFDGVFPVPRHAVARSNDTDRVFVATAGGIAEARAVTLADAVGDEVLVAQGLDVGDAVVIEAPADLHDGSRIVTDR